MILALENHSGRATRSGETSVLWGALGRLEGIVQSGDDEARWALLDRLGSVVAEATGAEGADISELVSYAEYGEPSFESVGYQNPYGFTGHLQDAVRAGHGFTSSPSVGCASLVVVPRK